MNHRVEIVYPPKMGLRGAVSYDDRAQKIGVSFPVPSVEKRVRKYLTTKRDYTIPKGPAIDDFEIETGYPRDNITYWELALCELQTHTDVWVDWPTQTKT